LRLAEFYSHLVHEGGKGNPTHLPLLPARRYRWFDAESTPGHSAAGRINSMKNPNDPLVNRTRALPACGAVSQPTAPQRAPAEAKGRQKVWKMNIFNEEIDFLRSTSCKLRSQIKENSTNDCDIVFKFIIPVTADHFDNSLRALRNLTTPLGELNREKLLEGT